MPNRTSPTAVRTILTTALTDPQVNAFIGDAEQWITENLASLSPAPSASILEIIERYLTCAIIKLREVTGASLTSRTIGDATDQYATPASVRDYLDAAAGFDTSGTVRKHFLAPRPVAAPTPLLYGAIARVGKGFSDDS